MAKHHSSFRLLSLLLAPALLTVSCGKDQDRPDPSQDTAEDDKGSEVVAPEESEPEMPASTLSKELDAQEVISWVPSYSIPAAKKVWAATYGEVEAPAALTRLGLQFWSMTADGGLLTLFDGDDDNARWFIERAHKRDIKVLATVTNSETESGGFGFDWSVVREGLSDEKYKLLVTALLELVERLDLDGVDVDFEAGGDGVLPYTKNDQELFATFVNHLGAELHKKNKLLTVDTFASDSSPVPKPSWWADWAGNVDTLHAMAYTTAFAGGLGNASYQEIQDSALRAGYESNQVLMGLPMWVDSWAGDDSGVGVSNVENVKFIGHCLTGGSGVALWAFDQPVSQTLPDGSGSPWNTEAPWLALVEVREGHLRDESNCAGASGDPNIIEDMGFVGINRRGGTWVAASDYWDRPEQERDKSTQVLTYDKSYDLALGEGVWGDVTNAYREVDGKRVMSSHVTAERLVFGNAWGGLWMEFLARDCTQLDEGDSSCGWNPSALTELDAPDAKRLVVGLRCKKDQEITIVVQSRREAIDYDEGLRGVFDCTGEFENYSIDLTEGSGALSRLQIMLETDSVPAAVDFDIAGVNLDDDVIE